MTRRDRVSVMGGILLGSIIGLLLVLQFGVLPPRRTTVPTEIYNGGLVLGAMVAVFFLLRGLYGPEDE